MDVLFGEQLHEVVHELHDAEDRRGVRPVALLDVPGDLALAPDAEDGSHGDDDTGAESPDDASPVTGHRSTSPKTGSTDPRMITRSEIVWPTANLDAIDRFENAGDRTFMRHGRTLPSETRNTPRVPRA